MLDMLRLLYVRVQAVAFLKRLAMAQELLSPQAMASYVYEPLQDPTTQIRLFSFPEAETTRAGPLRIAIATFALDEVPLYTALSYAWGEPETPDYILANDESFLVQPSCHYALQRMWLSSWPCQHFWVDAICINQQNDHEKGPQVQMMASIFGKAELVAISYGVDTNATAELMLRVETQVSMVESQPSRSPANRVCFSQQLQRHKATSGEKEATSDCLTGNAQDAFRQDAAHFSALVDIGSRPYWSRLWVVQEIFCARSTVVLHLNGHVPFQALLQFTRGLAHDFLQLTSDILPRWSACLRSLPMLRLLINVAGARRVHKKSAPLSLSHTLQKFGDRECREWRDRVYALINIVTCPPAVRDLAIDYQVSRADLAIAILDCYKGCSDVDILALADLLRRLLEVKNPHDEPKRSMRPHKEFSAVVTADATVTTTPSRCSSVYMTSIPRPLGRSTCAIRLSAPRLYTLRDMSQHTSMIKQGEYSDSAAVRGLCVDDCRGLERPRNPTREVTSVVRRRLAKQASPDQRIRLLPHDPAGLPGPRTLFCVHPRAPECSSQAMGFVCSTAQAGDLIVDLVSHQCSHAFEREAHLVPNMVIRRVGEIYALIGYALIFECGTRRRHREVLTGGTMTLHLDPADALLLSLTSSTCYHYRFFTSYPDPPTDQWTGIILSVLDAGICRDQWTSWAEVDRGDSIGAPKVGGTSGGEHAAAGYGKQEDPELATSQSKDLELPNR